MNGDPELHEFSLMEEGSVYIPFRGIAEEQKLSREDLDVHAAYAARIYRKHRIWIRPFVLLEPDKLDVPVYFRRSDYIPYFYRHGYRVECAEGIHLADYLERMPENSWVFVSVKDDGSQQIAGEAAERLSRLGIRAIDRERLRCSYLWVARKTGPATYEVAFEQCSEDRLSWEGVVDGLSVCVESGGALGGSCSTIRIDGKERSPDGRGFNVVSFRLSGSECEAHNFDTFATLYAQGGLFRALPPVGRPDSVPRLLSHAGGKIDGTNYTNCLEAMQRSYELRGHRWFELDLELTADGELVARHDWDELLYGLLKQERPEGEGESRPLTLERFMQTPILERYTPMSIKEVLLFLKEHPDSVLVTDTKYFDPLKVKIQFGKLVEAAKPLGLDLLLRVVPQLYRPEMYAEIERFFSFPRYAYTLYQTQASDEEVCRFVGERGIAFVVMTPERFNSSLGERLRSLGAEVWLHTLNEPREMRRYMKWEVDGFYTDEVSRSTLLEDRASFADEQAVRQSVLKRYLELELHIEHERAERLTAGLDLQEIAKLTESLFGAGTPEEKLALLSSYGLL